MSGQVQNGKELCLRFGITYSAGYKTKSGGDYMNPCVELCWQRYGKQYSPECDTKCDYAKAVAENKALKNINAESVDIVPVVRCKDCRYRFTSLCPTHSVEYDMENEPDIMFELDGENDFCSFGQRK